MKNKFNVSINEILTHSFSTKLILLVTIGTFFFASCKKCDPPSSGLGSVTVVTPIPPSAFVDCKYSNTTLQTEADIVRELNQGSNKWVVEFMVGGTCSNGKPWTLTFKKGDFTMVTFNGQIAFRLNNVPVSDGPININAQFITPCNSTSSFPSGCFTTNNGPWRNLLSGNLTVNAPVNGVVVGFNSSNSIKESTELNGQGRGC